MDDAKIVIAGTGRAGTTLLVQVLTELGCDTGFRPGVRPDEHARAGLERNVLAANAPRIVKSPRLSTKLRPMLEAGEVRLEHVIVPVRELEIAAASRVRAASYGREAKNWGGLFGTNRATKQREALALVLYELVYTLARFDVPHTLLLFPRFAEDPAYLHERLGWIAPERTAADFARALETTRDLSMIREEPLTAGERVRTSYGTLLFNALTRPLARVRAAVTSRKG